MESMESATVAKLVEYFNNASIAVLALFAVFGAIAVLYGRSRAGFFRERALLSAFCVAALAAFAVEAVFFNVPYYLKLFAGPEVEIMGAAPENPNVIRTSTGVPAELVNEKDEKTNVSRVGIAFKKLNMSVTSIFADVDFGGGETGEMTVSWTDGLSNANSITKKLHKHVPYDNYTPIQPYGEVSELKVMFIPSGGGKNTVEVTQVALNKQIPFYFSGLRLIVVASALFAIFCLLKKEPRARAAYYLFEYKFNPASYKQNSVHALTVLLLIFFAYMCVNTSYSKSYLSYPVHQQYNRFLVDALAEGRTWLKFGTPENLLKAERPYDNAYRLANGYKFNSDVMWDWTWYKGKFYCYYGVVPAVVVFLPYKLITGEYLSNNGGIFLFTSVIIILTAMLWRFCVKKYMPNCGFAFYTLSFLTLFFASGIFAQMRMTRFYSILQTAGLMFALGGCYLLLKSVENEKINRVKLFFACACLALTVGCRPNMIFVSLLVPLVLWKYRSWKLLSFVAIPYIVVAIPLCAYNYVRFDSIFEFGNKYVLTSHNFEIAKLTVPFGKLIQIFRAFAHYMAVPGQYSLFFPFVSSWPLQEEYVTGLFYHCQPGVGMVNFPIVFCLLYLFKNITAKKRAIPPKLSTNPHAGMRMSQGFIIVAAVIATVDSLMIGFEGRYLLDFAFFIILPSLFCAYYWYAGHDGTLQNKNRLSVVLILLVSSIFVGLFLCVTGTFVTGVAMQIEYNHVLYRYLECSLGIFRSV